MNHKVQSFKGMYIVKGNAADACKAVSMIGEKCSEFAQFSNKNVKDYYPNFTIMRKILLSSILGDLPITRYLVGTNEHAQNIVNWFKETECENDSLEYLLTIVENDAKKLKYMKPENEIIESSSKNAKEILKQVRKFATVPYNKPKTVQAADVIDAISKDTFNCITGEILTL